MTELWQTSDPSMVYWLDPTSVFFILDITLFMFKSILLLFTAEFPPDPSLDFPLVLPLALPPIVPPVPPPAPS